ncbi:MAG: Sec-independent protein translocase protein TatB [Acidobacteriota bacterium]|jgi:Tat protein translocase TatB subunit
MFGSIGGTELLLIMVIALLVFGPRKLPQLGRTIGKAMGEFRRASNDFRSSLEREIEAEEPSRGAQGFRPPAPPPPSSAVPRDRPDDGPGRQPAPDGGGTPEGPAAPATPQPGAGSGTAPEDRSAERREPRAGGPEGPPAPGAAPGKRAPSEGGTETDTDAGADRQEPRPEAGKPGE